MKTWWLNLLDRERHIVFFAAMITTFLLIVGFVWSPLLHAVAEQRQNIISQQHLLQWMNREDLRAQQYRHEGIDIRQAFGKPLLSLAETTLKRQHLSQYISVVQQPKPNELLLTLENIPFDAFINWVQMLFYSNAITVKSVDIKKTDIKGLVNVKLTLWRLSNT